MEDFSVILPAAGSGSRFGGGDKLLTEIGGKSVLRRSFELFAWRKDVARIVIVTAAERMEGYREHLGNPGRLSMVAGGSERWESVVNGLRFLAGGEGVPRFVGIHDAARPLCPQEVIDEAFESTRKRGAGLPCIPEPATLKRRGADGTVAETVDRKGLFQAQTPQCFELTTLLAGYEQLVRGNGAGDLTDDAQVYERMGLAVPMTAGSGRNLKMTTAGDVELARAILEARGVAGEK
jgi:2-C-methyl-D-erythritol 4-phosphate cytidylyltransferase